MKSDHRNRPNTDTIAALRTTKAVVKNATTFEPSKALMHARIKYSKDSDDDGEGRIKNSLLLTSAVSKMTVYSSNSDTGSFIFVCSLMAAIGLFFNM
ncbi:hypothetical protein WA026_010221 [Henosepilachna vigintioctopunctata]|uniref:Uncharacterized protein n=1 Tax=Henosepilachna vigintioctopunctata TaxID=420089 RepID=A0AAW1UKR3_9CUCU